MKKYLVFLLLIMSVSVVYAQDYYEHEIGFSIGVKGLTSQWNKFCDRAVPSMMEGTMECGGAALFDVYSLIGYDYSYRFSDRLSIGAMFMGAINRDTWEMAVDDGYDGIDVESSMICLMPFVKYAWYNSKKYDFRLYSKIGLGIGELQNSSYNWYERIVDDELYRIERQSAVMDESKSYMAYYIVPIAIETKRKHWNWFGELGIGDKVSVSAGLRYSYGKGKKK